VTLVHIVDGHDLAAGIAQESAEIPVALAADAHASDRDPVAGGRTPGSPQGRRGDKGRYGDRRADRGRPSEKPPTRERVLRDHSLFSYLKDFRFLVLVARFYAMEGSGFGVQDFPSTFCSNPES